MKDIFDFYDWEDVTVEDLIDFVTGKADIKCSELQRKFKWGYNRAGNVMDWLIENGIVDRGDGFGSRKVIMQKESAMKVVSYTPPAKDSL